MKNDEIAMILEDILKEFQAFKTEKINLPQLHLENGSKVSSQLDEIREALLFMNKKIQNIAENRKIDAPTIDFRPINQFREDLNELKEIQKITPKTQIVEHKHSFKNWQWLVLLFVFIASTFVLAWYALDNFYESKDLKVKYEFVRKEAPNHIRWIDSMYRANPTWIEKYEPSLKSTSVKLKQAKNYNKKRHK